MPTLAIWQGRNRTDVAFEGTPVLSLVLRQSDLAVDMPCGGRGVCGKCKVRAEGALSELTDREREAGSRLACKTVLLGDAEVWLTGKQELENIAAAGERPMFAFSPMAGRYGLAVDIGTTTLAATLLDLRNGETLASAALGNPQRSISADVVGRMEAAMDGQGVFLQSQVIRAIQALHSDVCAQALVEGADVMIATGNTTMLYLLTCRDPEPISHAPFEADCLFGGWTDTLPGIPSVYLPRCFGAFVGADISCAVLASGMCERSETALLVDVGTNGEMALWHNGTLHVCATAAGPAFEGGGIACGCGSVTGAIDHVWQQSNRLEFSTIGAAMPIGLCGSGLIDAIATLREVDELDETGLLLEERVTLGDNVYLTRKDVRSVQLAKSAIAAGVLTLLKTVGVSPADVRTLYLAGGFGKHINLRSASAIGLIPRTLTDRTKVIGNAALTGAEMLMLQTGFADKIDRYAALCEVVTLSGNSVFADYYMDCMMLEPIL